MTILGGVTRKSSYKIGLVVSILNLIFGVSKAALIL
jgi:hypothetical protein